MTCSSIRSFFTRCFSFSESKKLEPHRSAGQFKRRRRVQLQTLEDRTLPTTVDTFTNALGGAWSLGSNWNLGAPPTSTEDAVVTPGSSETVTLSSGSNTVHSLTSDGSLLISGGSLSVTDNIAGESQVASPGELYLSGTGSTEGNVALTVSSGAVVDISGSITNTGNTLTVTGSGSVLLTGTLTGGTLNLANGATLTGQNGTLSGVTLNGNVTVDGNHHVIVTNGLTLNGMATLGDSTGYGYLEFSGTQSLNGSATLTFGSTSTDNALDVPTSGTTLTIGSGVTVQGNTGYIGYDSNLGGSSTVSVISQGNVNANVSGGTIYLDAATAWTNQGSLLASGGTLDPVSGTGGSITVSGSGTLAGILSGATLTGSLTVSGSSSSGLANGLTITNGLTDNASITLGSSKYEGYLSFSGTQMLGGNGTITFATGMVEGSLNITSQSKNALFVPTSGTTLTIGSGITINGVTGYIGSDPNISNTTGVSIVNQGNINASVSGGAIYLDASTAWTNQGMLEASGGTLDFVNAFTGTIYGSTGGKVAGSLSGAILSGTLTVDNSTTMIITNGLTINGSLTLGDSTGFGCLDFSGTQMLGGSSTITFGSVNGDNALELTTSSTTLTIGSGIIVQGQGGYIGPALSLTSGGVVNLGLVDANTSGAAIGLNGTWTNQNMVEATNGGELALNIYSTLVGGTLSGSTGLLSGGSTNFSTLSGVTIDGNLTAFGEFLITNGLTLNGIMTLGNSTSSIESGTLDFSGTQTFGGNGTVTFSIYSHNTHGEIKNTSSATLTIGPNITLNGQSLEISFSGSVVNLGNIESAGLITIGSLLNEGTIAAVTAGGTLTLSGPNTNYTLENSGKLQASNGGTLSLVFETLTTTGVFEADTESTLYFDGTVTVDNSGNTFEIIGSGTVNMNGRIEGGTIDFAQTLNLHLYSVAYGVTVIGNLVVPNNDFFEVVDGLTLNGTMTLNNSFVWFDGTQALEGNGTIIFASPGTRESLVESSGETITIGPNITVQGQSGIIGYDPNIYYSSANFTVINEGTIIANESGGVISVVGSGGSFTNSGTLDASLGTISISTGASSVINNGTFAAGPTGTLAITGSFTQSATGSFDEVIGGSNSGLYGQLNITGAATLGGTLNVSEANGFMPSTGNIFSFLTFTSATGQFANYTGLTTNGMVVLQPVYNLESLTLIAPPVAIAIILTASAEPSPVDQPLTLAATVSSAITSGWTPTGTVNFLANGVVLNTVPVNSTGIATSITTALPIGEDSLTAVFSGDAYALPCTSGTLTELINQDESSIVVSSLQNPTVYGDTATFTATVSTVDFVAVTPTGTATFYDGLAPLGTESLVNGAATFTTASLAVGTHSISAIYSGDSNFLASTSPAIFQTVQASASPIVSVVINNGQQQRSMLTSISVDFTGVVDPTALASAFTLTRVGLPNGEAGDNAAPGAIIVTTSSDALGNTLATLTFSGDKTEAGSLSDGNWTLTIDAAQITAGGLPMASDYVQPDIKRLFGDITGSGTVDSTDLGIFGTTFGLTSANPAFIAGFDSDANGIIDSTDLGAFGTRFGLTI